MPSSQRLSAVDAYDELMEFASLRGVGATRLAIHAAVSQTFRPDLLHLLRLNFVPSFDNDISIEADVLRAPFTENLGGGYYQFDGEARRLLLDELVRGYPEEDRPQRVARFLTSYYDTLEIGLDAAQDRLLRDFIEIERWVALAYLDADEAARQLAAAINAMESSGPAARIEIGGLVRSIGAPLIRHPKLLEYAAGIEALRQGDLPRGEAMLNAVGGGDVDIVGVHLEAPAKVISRWRARYAATAVKPDVPPQDASRKNRERVASALDRAQAATDDGRYADARRILDQVASIATTVEDTLVLRYLRQKGVVLGLDGMRKESLDALLELHRVSTSVLGPDHPDTLDALSRVAWATLTLGRYEEAIEMQRDVLQRGEKVWGPDDERTVKAQFQLADFLATAGNQRSARTLLERLLETAVRHYGAEDPKTIDITRRVASAFADWGLRDKAVDLLEPVVRWAGRMSEENPEYRSIRDLYESLVGERDTELESGTTEVSQRSRYDVFLSYNRGDRSFAEVISTLLRDSGFSVFFDLAEMSSGEAFNVEIERAVHDSTAVIFLVSKKSATSQYSGIELELATRSGKTIIAIVLERGVELPLPWLNHQVLDLINWTGDPKDPRLGELVAAVHHLVGKPRGRTRNAEASKRSIWNRFTGFFSKEDEDEKSGSGSSSPPAV